MLKHHYLSGLLLALVAVIPWVRPSVGMIITAADINCEIQAENVRGVVQLRGIARQFCDFRYVSIRGHHGGPQRQFRHQSGRRLLGAPGAGKYTRRDQH